MSVCEHALNMPCFMASLGERSLLMRTMSGMLLISAHNLLTNTVSIFAFLVIFLYGSCLSTDKVENCINLLKITEQFM